MRIFKLAFLPILFLYSSFSFATWVVKYQASSNYDDLVTLCSNAVPEHGSHYQVVDYNEAGTLYQCQLWDGVEPPEPEPDCPPAGPVAGTRYSAPSKFNVGDIVIINGCEYVVIGGAMGSYTSTGYEGGMNMDSTGRSVPDIEAAGETLPPSLDLPDYEPALTGGGSTSAPNEPVDASSSSSSSNNPDGSTTSTGSTTSVTSNDDGSTTTTTTTTETTTNTDGTTTSTTSEVSTTQYPNGASTTSTSVTATGSDGTSTVVSQGTSTDNRVDDEAGGSVSGGTSCASPPNRSGDVTDAEFNQILQTYYLRCPPDKKAPVEYKPTGFDLDDLKAKVSDKQDDYSILIDSIKNEAQSLFNISVSSGSSISQNNVSIGGVNVDFSWHRFMSQLSIIGALIMALAYLRSFFIVFSTK